MERAQDSHDANDGFNWSHLQAAIDEVTGVTDTPGLCDDYGNDWRDITR
nr:hypothetical protein [Citrobacter freundii]